MATRKIQTGAQQSRWQDDEEVTPPTIGLYPTLSHSQSSTKTRQYFPIGFQAPEIERVQPSSSLSLTKHWQHPNLTSQPLPKIVVPHIPTTSCHQSSPNATTFFTLPRELRQAIIFRGIVENLISEVKLLRPPLNPRILSGKRLRYEKLYDYVSESLKRTVAHHGSQVATATSLHTRHWSKLAAFWKVQQFELRLGDYRRIHPLISDDIASVPKSWARYAMRNMMETVEKDVTGEGLKWWSAQDEEEEERWLDRCLT